MIKFTAITNVGPIIGIGLSRRNVELLMGGRPIQVTLKDFGFDEGLQAMPSTSIVLMFGETEELLAEELKAAGLINDQTKVTGKDSHGT